MSTDKPFKIEHCTIKPREFSIEFPNGDIKILQPKFIEVLNYLASQYPRLVDRQELIENIWDGNHFVGEKSLTNAIWNLRNELKQTGANYIETVRKKGYRLQVKPVYLDEEVADSDIPEKANWFKNTSTIAIASTLCLCLLVFGLFFINQSTTPPMRLSKTITNDPGREVYASVSPDEQHLIYSWRQIGQQPNLYLRNLTRLEEPAKQLTFSEDYEGRAVWHPNNETIYFQRKSWDYRECEIVALNVITIEEQVIAECQAEIDFALAISSSGQYLAFSNSTQDAQKPHVFLIDLANKNSQAPLYPCLDNCQYKDLDFAFSPDDKKVVISRTLDEGLSESIFVYDVKSKSFEFLTNSEGDVKGLVWHPSGNSVIYSAQVAGQRDGYSIDLKTKEKTKLGIVGFSYPTFLPQSTDLIYHNYQNLNHLSSIAIDEEVSSAPFPLVQSDYSYHSPHYSASTDQIVFVSNESGYNELWLSNIDGSKRQKLTSMSANLSFPKWSHNGEFIAFLGPRDGDNGNALYVLNVNSKVIKQLSSDVEQHFPPAWQLDDKALLAGARTGNDWGLYTFPISGDTPEKLLNRKVKMAQQTPDGQLWFSPGRNKGLWLLKKTAQVETVKQILPATVFNVSYQWQVADSAIYFVQEQADHVQFSRYDTTNEQLEAIVKLPTGTIDRMTTLTAIPSQNRVIFTQREFPKADIKQLSDPAFK